MDLDQQSTQIQKTIIMHMKLLNCQYLVVLTTGYHSGALSVILKIVLRKVNQLVKTLNQLEIQQLIQQKIVSIRMGNKKPSNIQKTQLFLVAAQP